MYLRNCSMAVFSQVCQVPKFLLSCREMCPFNSKFKLTEEANLFGLANIISHSISLNSSMRIFFFPVQCQGHSNSVIEFLATNYIIIFSILHLQSNSQSYYSSWMLHLAVSACRCLARGTALEGKDQRPINVSNFQMQITCHNAAENNSFIITIL